MKMNIIIVDLAVSALYHMRDDEVKDGFPGLSVVFGELLVQQLVQRVQHRALHDGEELRRDAVLKVPLPESLQVVGERLEVRPEETHGHVDHVHHDLGQRQVLGVLGVVVLFLELKQPFGAGLQLEDALEDELSRPLLVVLDGLETVPTHEHAHDGLVADVGHDVLGQSRRDEIRNG